VAVAVDDVCPGTVTMLVISDTVQVPDVIVGHVWLDSPEVAYNKVGGQLYIYLVEPWDGKTDSTVNMFGSVADNLHTVEVAGLPAVEPLVVEDFGYDNSELTPSEHEGLMDLVNRYCGCSAKNLRELGCTPLMTIDVHELSNWFADLTKRPRPTEKKSQRL